VFWFDPEKGFSCIRARYLDGDRTTALAEIEPVEASDGVWFPISMTQTSYEPDGKVGGIKTWSVDEDSLAVNCGPFPKKVFELTIPEQAEVSDYRAGMKMLYRHGADALAEQADMDLLVSEAKEMAAAGDSNLGADEHAPRPEGIQAPVASDAWLLREHLARWAVIAVGAAILGVGTWILIARRHRKRPKP